MPHKCGMALSRTVKRCLLFQEVLQKENKASFLGNRDNASFLFSQKHGPFFGKEEQGLFSQKRD